MRVFEWKTHMRNESKVILRNNVIGNSAETMNGTIGRS